MTNCANRFQRIEDLVETCSQAAGELLQPRAMNHPFAEGAPPIEGVLFRTVREAVTRSPKLNFPGANATEKCNALRAELDEAARFLLSLPGREALEENLDMRAYLLANTDRWCEMKEDGAVSADSFTASGYRFKSKFNRSPEAVRSHLLERVRIGDSDAEKQCLESQVDYVCASGKGDQLYQPEARYDEVYLECLTGLWSAAFFCGYRLSRVWAHVRWVVAHRTSAYPDGICTFKACGDVVRATHRSMLEIGPHLAGMRHPTGLIDIRLRIWADNPILLDWGQYCAANPTIGDREILHQCDLTSRSFRRLGALYYLLMLHIYIRDGVPLTYIFSDDNLQSRQLSEDQKLCLRLLFWPVRETYYKPVPPREGGRRIAVYALKGHIGLPSSVLGFGRGMMVTKQKDSFAYSGRAADEDFLWGTHRILKDTSVEFSKRRAKAVDVLDLAFQGWPDVSALTPP